MKRLDFISNPLVCAKCFGTWKSVYMAVEFLFLEGFLLKLLGDRFHGELRGQINYDLGIAAPCGLHLATPRLKTISGRYKYNAVPI